MPTNLRCLSAWSLQDCFHHNLNPFRSQISKWFLSKIYCLVCIKFMPILVLNFRQVFAEGVGVSTLGSQTNYFFTNRKLPPLSREAEGLPLLVTSRCAYCNHVISSHRSLTFWVTNGGRVIGSVFLLLNHLYLIGKLGSCNSVSRTCSITSCNHFSSQGITIWSKQLNKQSYVIL